MTEHFPYVSVKSAKQLKIGLKPIFTTETELGVFTTDLLSLLLVFLLPENSFCFLKIIITDICSRSSTWPGLYHKWLLCQKAVSSSFSPGTSPPHLICLQSQSKSPRSPLPKPPNPEQPIPNAGSFLLHCHVSKPPVWEPAWVRSKATVKNDTQRGRTVVGEGGVIIIKINF